MTIPGGKRSIINVYGANVLYQEDIPDNWNSVIKGADILLMQRVIP